VTDPTYSVTLFSFICVFAECGEKTYYTIKSKCCDGVIQPRLPTAFCCGKQVYYERLLEECIDGEVIKPKIIKMK